MKMIIGTHYTQADSWTRDYAADFETALKTENPLMFLHGLGYDVSEAKVV